MSFIRKKVSAYPWPVEVRKPSEEVAGEFETHKFIVKFKRLSKKALNEFTEKEDLEALQKIVAGWSDIKDEEGKDIAFSAKTLKEMADDIDFVNGVVSAFTKFYANADEKN